MQGSSAVGIDGSAFIGTNAGTNTSASYSNFMGINSGADATNADNSNFFGFNAGASTANVIYIALKIHSFGDILIFNT